MSRFLPILAVALAVLAGCEGTGTRVSVGGSAAVGVSTGQGYPVWRGPGGPPPGRTEAERRARREYYQGPRGLEF